MYPRDTNVSWEDVEVEIHWIYGSKDTRHQYWALLHLPGASPGRTHDDILLSGGELAVPAVMPPSEFRWQLPQSRASFCSLDTAVFNSDAPSVAYYLCDQPPEVIQETPNTCQGKLDELNTPADAGCARSKDI